MATVTVNGVTYTDDDNATTGLANGGHRTRLVPMFGNAVTDLGDKKDAAASSQSAAASSAAAAVVSKDAAAASAASAASSAAGFVGTSTTSLLIATGAKSFTTQSGEQYTVGIWVTAVSAANNANYMYGQVTSYSGTTLAVDVQVIGGSGTLADWNLSLTGTRGAIGPAGTLGGVATSTVDLLTGAAIASAATVNLD